MKKLNRYRIILIIAIGISSSILLSACTREIPILVPKPYPVVVPCVVPDVDCNKFKHTGDSLEEELSMCIHELREKQNICKGK